MSSNASVSSNSLSPALSVCDVTTASRTLWRPWQCCRTPTPPCPVRRLNGALIKYDRGEKHLAEVAAIANNFREGGATLYSEGEKPDIVYRVRLGEGPPVELGAIIGDFLHNMRSSLDLVACCLVQHYEPTASLALVQFPIGDPHGALPANERKRLASSDKVIQIVEEIRGRYPDALAALHALSNQDKHRLMTTAATRAQVARVDIDEEANIAKLIVTPDNDPKMWRRPLHDGDIIAVGKIPGMGIGFTLALLVDDNAIPITVLNSILWAVGDVLGFAQWGKWSERRPDEKVPE